MLLSIDIGNSNIKFAIFSGNELVEFKVYSEIDESLQYLNSKTFSNAAICSVNHAKEKILIDTLFKRNTNIFIPTVNSKLNLKIKYKTPDTLGIDRVCSAVGAYELAIKKSII
ncbi:MAG: type III pantothenate kinase [Ignavibacteriaceae bacterium]